MSWSDGTRRAVAGGRARVPPAGRVLGLLVLAGVLAGIVVVVVTARPPTSPPVGAPVDRPSDPASSSSPVPSSTPLGAQPIAVAERGCGWFVAYEPDVLRAVRSVEVRRTVDPAAAAVLEDAVEGDVEDLRGLVAAGGPVDVVAPGFAYTPLTASVSSRCRAAVHLLLAAGADPDLAPPGRDPPLVVAALVRDAQAVAALLNAGADRDRSGTSGLTAREVAKILGDGDIVAVLDHRAPVTH